MKKIILLACLGSVSITGFAQLVTQASGLSIQPGTIFSTEGLVLTPTAGLVISSNTISRSATPITSSGGGTSIARVFQIAQPLTFSGTVGIYYENSELNGNQAGSLEIAFASSGTDYITLSNSVPGTNYVYSDGFANALLASVTATNNDVVLPIRFSDFTALANGACGTDLSWQADEARVENFTVERSADARSWQAVKGSIYVEGNDFRLTDDNPKPGMNFYRLAVNEPGSATVYSKLKSVNNTCAGSSLVRIYPNPASDVIRLDFNPGSVENAEVRLLDPFGKCLEAVRVNQASETLSIRHLSNGVYYVQVRQGQHIQTTKVVKF